MLKSEFYKFFSDISELFGIDLEQYLQFKEGRVTFLDETGLAKKLHTCPEKFLNSKAYFEQNCSNMLEYLRFFLVRSNYINVLTIQYF